LSMISTGTPLFHWITCNIHWSPTGSMQVSLVGFCCQVKYHWFYVDLHWLGTGWWIFPLESTWGSTWLNSHNTLYGSPPKLFFAAEKYLNSTVFLVISMWVWLLFVVGWPPGPLGIPLQGLPMWQVVLLVMRPVKGLLRSLNTIYLLGLLVGLFNLDFFYWIWCRLRAPRQCMGLLNLAGLS
jgi:hypothetical protein